MDDCLTGANSVQEACSLRQELNQLLNKAHMTLRKWRTNSSELLATIPEELRETSNLDISLSPTEHGKALGLRWDTSSDVLYVCTSEFSSDLLATKCSVSSIIAKTFDLMGWYAPAVLPAKLILQELWTLRLGWDEPLPETLQQQWKWWLSELPLINRHPVSRYIGKSLSQVLHWSIHGFCDASSKAYGGVIYLHTVFEDTTVSIDLIMAKNRVAPIKSQTIPRLELCRAQLLSKVLQQVAADFSIPEKAIFAWTDSSMVLGWLKTPHNRLKIFVAHRVSDITSRITANHWRYVHTSCNPADLVSRGIRPSELLQSKLWWNGPPWLSLSPAHWPRRPDIDRKDSLPDLKPAVLIVQLIPDEFSLWCSNFTRLCRVTAWIHHFLKRTRGRHKFKTTYLTVSELRVAKNTPASKSKSYLW